MRPNLAERRLSEYELIAQYLDLLSFGGGDYADINLIAGGDGYYAYGPAVGNRNRRNHSHSSESVVRSWAVIDTIASGWRSNQCEDVPSSLGGTVVFVLVL